VGCSRSPGPRLVDDREALPEGLVGGYVGYLGYECKYDCGSPNAHRSPLPDAVLMLANRVVAVDHLAGVTRLYALSSAEDAADAKSWLQSASAVASDLIEHGPSEAEVRCRVPQSDASDLEEAEGLTFRLGRGRERYLADIARCQAALAAGESYEVCLADQIHAGAVSAPFVLYRHLRRRNPAPFAAYLKLDGLAIASSSPERFLGIERDGVVHARPIKGTSPRAADPAVDEANRAALLDDEKTFAAHLMIVDLLRNDLGRVCTLDSVRVPEFMVVERYTTVQYGAVDTTWIVYGPRKRFAGAVIGERAPWLFQAPHEHVS
jgi:para-aminobenzoate synthetase